MPTEKQKIVDVLHQYQKGTNTADAHLTASLYKEDAHLIPYGFAKAIGKKAIFEFYDYAFSLLQLTLDFAIYMDEIIIHGDVAYATTTSLGTRVIRESKATIPEDNRELWIFEKIHDDWKIARYMFNVPPAN